MGFIRRFFFDAGSFDLFKRIQINQSPAFQPTRLCRCAFVFRAWPTPGAVKSPDAFDRGPAASTKNIAAKLAEIFFFEVDASAAATRSENLSRNSGWGGVSKPDEETR
jgi:hypothetical protein